LQIMSSEHRKQEKDNNCEVDESASQFNTSLDFIMHVWRKMFCEEIITPDMDIFIDLGAHSMLVAQCVSALRAGHFNLQVNPFESIGLVDLYTLRTGAGIAEKYPLTSVAKNVIDTLSRPPFQEISFWRHFFCGLAQFSLLLIIFFLYGTSTLMPLMISEYYYQTRSSFVAGFLSLYLSNMVFPYVMMAIALGAKWTLIGRAKAGTYPLWGWFYLRWWFVGQLMSLVDLSTLNETTWINIWWRLLGAKIGKHVHMGGLHVVCADLVSIGDNTTMNKGVALVTEFVDNGSLHVGTIHIGSNCFIGTSCTIEANSIVKDYAELLNMTGVVEGTTIPMREVHGGSPSKFISKAEPWQIKCIPSPFRSFVARYTQLLTYTIIMPFLNILPVGPVLVLFNVPIFPDSFSVHAQILSLAGVVGLLYVFFVILELIFFKWILLGKVKPGTYFTYSWFGLRKWFVDALMAKSLSTIHTLYATVYCSPLMRLLGAKVGSRSEISTARNITPDLIEIGKYCFIADNVVLGDDNTRGYIMKLDKTTIKNRSFIGNGGLIPQGVSLPSDCLVGVFSVPLKSMEEGESCFGLPPILMPTRAKDQIFDLKLLYHPSLSLRLCRLFIETIRIWLPPALLGLGIGMSTQFILAAYPIYFLPDTGRIPTFMNMGTPVPTLIVHQLASSNITTANQAFASLHPHQAVFTNPLTNQLITKNIIWLILTCPIYYIGFIVLPGLILLFVLKWLFIGKYKPCVLPMYSFGVWSSEFITGVLEHIAPSALTPLVGTPFLPWIYMLFGSKIGARCFMASVDIPEFDMIEIGDDVAVNASSFPQTHLFEDRIMKIAHTKLGDRSTMRVLSKLLPNSEIGHDVTLGCNSVVMKGESLQSLSTWIGFPVQLAAVQPQEPVTLVFHDEYHESSHTNLTFDLIFEITSMASLNATSVLNSLTSNNSVNVAVNSALAVGIGSYVYSKCTTGPHPPAHYSQPDNSTIEENYGAIYRRGSFPTLECPTLLALLQDAVQKYPQYNYLGHRPIDAQGNAGPFVWENYENVYTRIQHIASGLMHEKMVPETSDGRRMICIYMKNRPEWTLAQFSTFYCGAFIVPLYDTLGTTSTQFILNQTEAPTVFCTSLEYPKLLEKASPFLKYVVVCDVDSIAQENIAAAAKHNIRVIALTELESIGQKNLVPPMPLQSSDLCITMYTSGTTGDPKGAMMSHGNLLGLIYSLEERFNHGRVTTMFKNHPILLSYLPLAHVAEQQLHVMVLRYAGAIGFYQGSTAKILDDLKELRPTMFLSVPRLLNKIYDKVMNAGLNAGGLKGKLFKLAINTKLANLKAGYSTHALYDKIIFSKIKTQLGLDRCDLMISGAAPLSPHVLSFFRVILSCLCFEVYGQTECAGASNSTDYRELDAGPVGPPVTSCHVRLMSVPEMGYNITDTVHGEGVHQVAVNGRGEICMYGPTIFMGYYKNPEKTAEALDENGWLHSGDIGIWTLDGRLKIVDRKKNIFKLSQGEYVAPEKIENIIKDSPFVNQSFVYGDSLHATLVAVVVPEEFEVAKFQLPGTFADWCADSTVARTILADLQRVSKQQGLLGYEIVNSIVLSAEPFSVDNNMLTPTFKIRRNDIKKAFMHQIDMLYAKEAVAGEQLKQE
ncbi:long-chain-fatty-acid-CoA ligase, partial [Thraustotheca clavata]